MVQDNKLLPIPQDSYAMELGAMDGGMPADGSPTSIQKLHQMMRGRYRWAVPLALLLAAALGTGGYYLKDDLYQGAGQVRVAANVQRLIYDTPDTGTIPYYRTFLDTQQRLLGSAQVIRRALDSTDMSPYGLDSHSDETVNELRQRLDVRIPTGSEVLLVSFTDPDPKFAAAFVKSAIESYMHLFGQQDEQDHLKRVDLLEKRRIDLENRLRVLNDRKLAIARQFGSDSLREMANFKLEEFQKIEAMLKETEAALASRGTDGSDAIEDEDLASMSLVALARRDAILADRLRQKREIEANIELKRGLGFGPRHIDIRRLEANLGIVNQFVQERVQEIMAAGTVGLVSATPTAVDTGTLSLAPIEVLVRRRQELRKLYEDARQEMERYGTARVQIDQINEEIEVIKRRMADVRFELDRREVERFAGDRIEVVTTGTVPTSPVNRGARKQLAVMGGMAGFMLGFGIVLLVGFLDQRLRSIDDAKTGLHRARMLGILPSLPEDLADPTQASIAAHCVHHVRTMLQIGADPSERQIFSVTSPGPGAGKTSLTLALGLSFAAASHRTLLIDCDLVGGGLTRRVAAVVRRRIGHMLQRQGLVSAQQVEEALRVAQNSQKRLGEVLVELGYVSDADLSQALSLQEESSVGVMDACNGEALDNCIAETGIRNLFVLPTGSAVARHAGSLSPAAIRRLFAQAREKFDIILVDSGPILGSIEASIVAGEVDASVMIISRGDPRGAADKSVEYLESIGANLLGIVFNRAEAHDFERSSYGSIASISSRRPDDRIVETEIIDNDASARLGPVGSAVVSNSRITPNGNRRRK